MARIVAWGTAFAVVAAILQSTLLSRLAVYHVVPDLVLGVIVYIAYVNGTMAGQLTGFFAGFALDFLSAAPLGFNALVRTVIGAIAGAVKGTFFLDILLLPAALCAIATLAKAVLVLALHLLFAGAVPAYSFAAPTLWIEVALNAATAPPLFALLKLFRKILQPRQGS